MASEKDRLNAYVDNETTKLIQQIQLYYKQKLGIKITIGMAVDIMAKEYSSNKRS